jgi:glycosyltransferase involved in cell wall biosynthesis
LIVESARTPGRLAYLLSQYPAVNHVFMLREIRSLRALGFEIHVASIRPPDRDLSLMTELEREETQSTHYVTKFRLFRLAWSHFHTLVSRPVSYVHGLACALRGSMGSPRQMLYGLIYFAEAIDVGYWMMHHRLLHVHTHYASTVALIIARTFPVTLSVTFHGPAEFQDPLAFRLREKVRASLFSCAISQYGLGQLMYACGYPEWPKLELTPLGVDLGEFLPRSFWPDPAPFQIICVGRLASAKGQHVLIAAMDLLIQEGRAIRLRFAGDGPEYAELQRDVNSRGLSGYVFFEGNLNQDQLRLLYRESDALVLPSFAEGLPVVLMEAMAMEIPCIATWVAGVPELIRDEVNGLLVPAGDAQSLARAIARLDTDPALRLRLGQHARQRVQEAFDVHKNVARLAEVFHRWLT